MKDNERMNLLLSELNETANSFAKTIGLHPTNIYHVLNGRNKISDKLATLIINKYDQINPDWLTHGKGEIYNKITTTITHENKTISMALGEYEFGDISIEPNGEKFIIPGMSEGFLIRVRDDSMSPLYNPGDLVSARFVELTSPIIWGKNYIVLTSNIGIIRKLLPGNENEIKMVSINSNYPELVMDNKIIKKLAKISGVVHLE